MTRIRNRFRRSGVLALAAGATMAVSACGISTQQEMQMGQEYAQEIARQVPLVNDATVLRYLNNLGRSIAQGGNRSIPYNFYMVDAPQVNAFAVPGGHIYVNRGLVERTRNESELAGVLAHEIAHVEHRHGIDQMERAQGANLALTAAYVLMGRAPSGVEEALIGVGGQLYFARHSREAENEADATAVSLLVRTGISPQGLPTFFGVLLEEQQRQPGAVEQWFSTHPLTTDRVANTQAMINQYPQNTLQRLRTNSSGFSAMQNRLRQLPRRG
ncbi:MAG TPA: M48 family metallopeptidase [Longimicrobiales bacterium]|nr:M48 family metallopeptidase [Longimicrobiales bacterium]